MTSKTSLFNKGIFNSTIKRFLWGSILYFALLFISTSLPFLIDNPSHFVRLHTKKGWYLFDYGTSDLSVVISSIVPYIVGLLVFRFIHSKKQSIFIHSLPVNRSTNYISATLGAFTLMIVPVILNGLILFIMSMTTYSMVISPLSVVIWICINILAQIIMYSIASFCCNLTGNSFGAVVIYLILHLVPFIITATMDTVLQNILNGYRGNNALADMIAEANPFSYLVTLTNAITNLFAKSQDTIIYNTSVFNAIWIYLAAAITLLVASMILYKNRNLENVEEVAGFKVLNPVLKYIVTSTIAFVTFAAAIEFSHKSPVAFIITFLLTTSVAYFICEMVLKKTLKVFGSYKGYLGFVTVIAVLAITMNITNGFGYERRIPERKDIKSVSVSGYNGYNQNATVENNDVIEYALKLHKNQMNMPILRPDFDRAYSTLNIVYTLKNDKTFKRSYRVESSVMDDIIDNLYKYEEYVRKYDDFYSRGDSEITGMQLNDDAHSKEFAIDHDQIDGLYNALEKDILSLGYKEMNCIQNEYSLSIAMSYIVKPESINNTPTHSYRGYKSSIDEYSRIQSVRITPKYKNTFKWLENEGYLALVNIPNNGKLYLRKGGYSYIDGVEFQPGTIKITDEQDTKEILDFIQKNSTKSIDSSDIYTVYYNPNPSVTSSVRELCEVDVKLMPEKFKKYIR